MDEYLFHQIKNENIIQEARRALSVARSRCLPFDAMLVRLKRGIDDENFAELVQAMIDLERTADQNRKVATLISDLAVTAEQLPTGSKDKLDRKLAQLLCCLPNDVARPLVVSFLSHPRKLRRQAGLKALNIHSVDDELCETLLTRFQETRDNSFLKALLKHPLNLSITSPVFLMNQFEDEYWQMRVVQSTLEASITLGMSFASTHPLPFIWASGRVGDRRLIPLILDCLERAIDRIPLLSITIWALGKLGAARELDDIEPLLEVLTAEHQNRFSKMLGDPNL